MSCKTKNATNGKCIVDSTSHDILHSSSCTVGDVHEAREVQCEAKDDVYDIGTTQVGYHTKKPPEWYENWRYANLSLSDALHVVHDELFDYNDALELSIVQNWFAL